MTTPLKIDYYDPLLMIPTEWEDQCKLPQFQDIKKDNRKAGTFEFQYTDALGGIRSMSYQLGKSI